MSKSKGGKYSRIELTDSDDEIAIAIRKSVTDCTSRVSYDPDNRPGVANLIEVIACKELYACFKVNN